MVEVTNVVVNNIEGALRGMRNPLNSWAMSDSTFGETITVGANDLGLMRRLYKAGGEHRKFLRQIFVSMDVTAPLYWWKQMDQYKVGTVTNSCSTMHRLAAKEFELGDFSHENMLPLDGLVTLRNIIDSLNHWRCLYLEEEDAELKRAWWWQMVQILPSSYNQMRTLTMDYENVVAIINQRAGHKLQEWDDFVAVLRGLPLIKEITDGG